MKPHRVLFVCMGNICRSPTAEGVMRTLVREAGLQDRILVDSAGTHGYHVGDGPDPRTQAAARRRGYELGDLRARQIGHADFEVFDLVLAMDFNNLERLQDLCPPEHQGKLGLLMPYAMKRHALIVHDPYYRSRREFELVLDYVEDACEGLVRALVPQAFQTAAGQALASVQIRKGVPEPFSAAHAASSNGIR
jgi:protein-tyrosine phosphatase